MGPDPTAPARSLSLFFWLFAVAHLALWTLVPLVIQPNPPLDAVELVSWGHEWRLGYPKHPPLAAWLAEAARSLGGVGGLWSIYLVGQLCIVTAFWAVWRLGREMTSAPVALAAVLLLETTGRYTWMTLELNNNVAVCPFFPLTALCVYRALASGRLRWWIAAGGSFGLGLMMKYTIVLLAVAIAVLLLASREARRRATAPGPFVALGVTALIALPHAIWMVVNGFPTLSYAMERGQSDAGLAGHLLNPADFVGSQFLMLEFFWIALLFVLAWPWRRRVLDPPDRFRRQFLIAVSLGPGLLSLVASAVTGMRLREVWGMPIWSLVPLCALFCLDLRPEAQVFKRAVLAAAIVVVPNVGLAVAEGVIGPYVTGDALRTQFPGQLLAREVVERWRQRFAAPLELVGGDRWLAGNVAFWAPTRPSTFTNRGLRSPFLDEAASPWTSVADFRERGGVLVWLIGREEVPLPYEFRRHFPDAEVLPPLTLSFQTRAPVKPLQVGLAIVAPKALSRRR